MSNSNRSPNPNKNQNENKPKILSNSPKINDKQLSTLNLSGKIYQEIKQILSLPIYNNLSTLIIHNSSLSFIPPLPHSLQILDLSHNNIKRIQNIKHLKYLRILKLSHNKIYKIENLSSNQLLSELYLSYNYIKIIENLHSQQYLLLLDLRFNQFSNIKEFHKLMGVGHQQSFANMKYLFVDGNEFANKILNYRKYLFQILPNLQMIDHKSIQVLNNNEMYAERKSIQSSFKVKNRRRPRYMSSTISKKMRNALTSDKLMKRNNSRTNQRNVSYKRSTKSMFALSPKNPRKLRAESESDFRKQYRSGCPPAWTHFNHYTYNTHQRKKRFESEISHQISQIPYHTKSKMHGNSAKNISVNIQYKNPIISEEQLHPSLIKRSINSKPAIPISQKKIKINEGLVQKPAKTKMKGVIKKLNEKINKLYSWHLVEIDLVSKQQLQLNDMRSELNVTKECIHSWVSTTKSLVATTPLKLLDTPLSKISQSKQEREQINSKMNDEQSNNISDSEMSSHSCSIQKPQFIRNTLKKCYNILSKENNTTNDELEVVENLVHQLESDIEANKQLKQIMKDQQKQQQKRLSINICENQKHEKNNEDGSNGEESVNSFDTEQNSILKEVDEYHTEIDGIEKALFAMVISATDDEDDNFTSKKETEKENVDRKISVKDIKDEDVLVSYKSLIISPTASLPPPPPRNKSLIITEEKKLEYDNKQLMNEWLSELAEELNTCRLSLQHLMDITHVKSKNRRAKVEQFNVVAEKCDMFDVFNISDSIQKMVKTLSLSSQVNIHTYIDELQLMKNAIHKLVVNVMQEKSEDIIQQQRQNVLRDKLIMNDKNESDEDAQLHII